VKRTIASVLNWLDDRTGHRAILSQLLDEKLPPGTAWAFTLGSVLLVTLSVQFLTGVLLGLFYAPTPDHAWDSVMYISTQVRAGAFLRGLHHWGSTIIVVASVLHLSRVVFFGSYKKPREANWIVGLLLLQVILAFGLTGYLLPWDQRAYWATTVTINIAKLTPLGGDFLAALMRGGRDIGALTLTRWYAVHVLVLPVFLVGLTVVHLYLMRRHHISGPVTPKAGRSESFFAHQAARDLTMAILVGILMAVLAWKMSPTLEAPADPTSSDYIPRPEWYFLGLFQLLKYFPGRLEVIGALVIPGAVITLLALLPWIDRGPSRRWRDRPIVLAAFTGGLAAAIALTALGAGDRPPAAAGLWKYGVAPEDLVAVKLVSRECLKCHTIDGAGGKDGPELKNIAAKYDLATLQQRIADPAVLMPEAEMPPFKDTLTADEIRAIAKWLIRQ
jgi:ubiquinol-cytochrome c reductase cytochrome b subunit